MYISKIKIQNFRSIKEDTIILKSGKNIIVGKNNSGKTNIIKAIDLVLGNYKFQPETDFYNNNTNEKVVIEIDIKINEENINWDEIIGKGFKYYFKQNDFIPDSSFVFDDKSGYWVTTEGWKGSTKPNELLKNVKKISIYLEYTFDETNQKNPVKCKEFVYFDSHYSTPNARVITNKINWVNSVFSSFILDSFRDPFSALKATKSNWYGKLTQKITENFNKSISDQIKIIGEKEKEYFNKSNQELNKITNQGAFQDTELSFSLGLDVTSDFYKQIRINADDGVKADISQKGSGIQSAIIISLFIIYVQQLLESKNLSSLFCIEEPEVYLHPHGRRSVDYKLDQYLKIPNTQLIVTTHSIDFITLANNNINLIRIEKTKKNGTKSKELSDIGKQDRIIFANKESLEMFFSDFVILCEGADKFILERYCAEQNGVNWLNDNNISIIRTGGKNNFCKYVEILNKLNIKWFIVGDLDNILNNNSKLGDFIIFGEQLKKDKSELCKLVTIYLEDKKSIKSKDISNLSNSELLQSLVSNIENAIFDEETKDLAQLIKDKILKGKISQHLGFENNEIKKINQLIDQINTELVKYNFWLLKKGELEDYDTENHCGKHKEIEVLEFLANLEEIETLESKGFETKEFKQIFEIIINSIKK